LQKKCKINKTINKTQKEDNGQVDNELKRKRNESNGESKRYFVSGISFKTSIDDFKKLVAKLNINCTEVDVPFDEGRGNIRGFA